MSVSAIIGSCRRFSTRPRRLLQAAAEALVRVGRRFDQRGWVMGTSGNFSTVVARQPLRLAITPSGTFKGELDAAQILEMDDAGRGRRRRSRLSRGAAARRDCPRPRRRRCAAHAFDLEHAPLRPFRRRGRVRDRGLRDAQGLEGVRSHEHREWLPIVENDQDMARLAVVVRDTLDAHPAAHCVLLRRHGLYTWGVDLSAGRPPRRDSRVLAGSRWEDKLSAVSHQLSADGSTSRPRMRAEHGRHQDSV